MSGKKMDVQSRLNRLEAAVEKLTGAASATEAAPMTGRWQSTPPRMQGEAMGDITGLAMEQVMCELDGPGWLASDREMIARAIAAADRAGWERCKTACFAASRDGRRLILDMTYTEPKP